VAACQLVRAWTKTTACHADLVCKALYLFIKWVTFGLAQGLSVLLAVVESVVV
jgi:hypothetical protein